MHPVNALFHQIPIFPLSQYCDVYSNSLQQEKKYRVAQTCIIRLHYVSLRNAYLLYFFKVLNSNVDGFIVL